MRTSDCDILIVPGLGGSGPDHWQSRWQAKLKTARRVEQVDWNRPARGAWESRLIEEAARSSRPAVIVAHSLGVVLTVLAAQALGAENIAGAFLVAPPDVERGDAAALVGDTFSPVPRDPLPFPSTLVASRNDPWCDYAHAEDAAFAWGAHLVDGGESGHVNPDSGHGPWPEGLMSFAAFLRKL